MLIVHSNTRSLFKGFDMSTANQRLDGILAKNAGIWRGTTTFRVYDVGIWAGYAYTPWAKLINFRLQNNTFVWDIVMKSTSDCVDFGTRIRAVLIQAREVGIVTAVGGSAYGPSPTVAQCQTVYNGYINHFVIQVSF